MVLALIKYPVWTGGYRELDADPVLGPWIWSDGSDWSYDNWKQGGPDMGGGNGTSMYYVYMKTMGTWDDVRVRLDGGWRFVCEYKL